MSRKECLEKIKNLPLLPGVYLMKDRTGTIIYVGKAKKIKNRVSQYFVGSHTIKVQKMADQIDDFDYIVTPSETEALILENNLIKLHRPKYNILLKDDKSYPYLALDRSKEYPTLMLCRRREKDKKIYFGPFASGKTVRDIKRQTEQLFGLVTCTPKIGTKPCLSYQLGHCSGVCTGKVSRQEYDSRVEQALDFLKGDYKKVAAALKEQMQAYAEALEFEKAASVRDRLRSIERLGQQQIMVLAPDKEEDVFGAALWQGKQCVSVMTIRGGRICRKEQYFPTAESETLLSDFVQQYYADRVEVPSKVVYRGSQNDEVLFAWLRQKREGAVNAVDPQRGEQLRLVAMAEKNALEALQMKAALQQKEKRICVELGEFLQLKNTPHRIEMYDISNFGEDAMVGGMIVWQNGALRKQQYRRFVIDQPGIDDYGATRQVLCRRLQEYQKKTDGFEIPPDIILMDGGKGHIGAVQEVVQSFLPQCALYGLVKDGRHRTRAIVLPDGSELGLSASPYWYKFFTRLQEEVHRFAISFMRQRKSKQMTSSELTRIPGVGPERGQRLLEHFKTLSAIQNADLTELQAMPGLPQSVALAIYRYFHD